MGTAPGVQPRHNAFLCNIQALYIDAIHKLFLACF